MRLISILLESVVFHAGQYILAWSPRFSPRLFYRPVVEITLSHRRVEKSWRGAVHGWVSSVYGF